MKNYRLPQLINSEKSQSCFTHIELWQQNETSKAMAMVIQWQGSFIRAISIDETIMLNSSHSRINLK